ncbi:MAG TPA: hypothetical protein VKS78_16080 [Roseiarcus sp.]|nr:hypothetical protein [Roseiarcus sp.]
MGDSLIAALLLLLLLASSAFGLWLQRRLGERHKTRETADAVRLVISILVTFTALVLGLVTSSVKSSFDEFDGRWRGYAAALTELDLRLREYGASTEPIRSKLRTYVAAAIADTWRSETPPDGDYPRFPQSPSLERQPLGALLVAIDIDIRQLEPTDAFHRQLISLLEDNMAQTLQQRWRLIGTAHDTISTPLLGLMTSWLVMIFGVFGLISPRNAVIYATILLCAVSISSAVYLIMDLDQPLGGFITVSSEPMRDVLRHIDARL